MKKRKAWTPEERRAFADRDILKAQRISDKRKKRDKEACREFRWKHE
jgi:hypothetical protein